MSSVDRQWPNLTFSKLPSFGILHTSYCANRAPVGRMFVIAGNTAHYPANNTNNILAWTLVSINHPFCPRVRESSFEPLIRKSNVMDPAASH